MSDRQDVDGVLELTEEMTSETNPSNKEAEKQSEIEPDIESRTPSKQDVSEAKTNFEVAPVTSEFAVITTPIVSLGSSEPTQRLTDADKITPKQSAPPTPDEDAGENINDSDSDGIMELGVDLVVQEPAQPVEDKSAASKPLLIESIIPPPSEDTEPLELGEAHVVEKEILEQTESLQNTYDFGTPEMVFDSIGAQEPEELSSEDLNEEVEEELDVSELEDVTTLKPMSESFLEAAAEKSKTRKARPRKRRRRHKSEWWSQIFNDEYLMLLPPYTQRDTRREVDFIQQTLGVDPGGLILDLACGSGRHAVGMAQRNFGVVGVDLSLSMLARAGELAQEAGQKINFIHGDMRDLGFNSTFDGVYCVDTSFGYFDEPTNLNVLKGVYKALKPGAPFLMEIANRDFVIAQQPNMTWFQMENLVCMEETDFNYINSRLYITRQVILGNNEAQSRYKFSVRLYSLHEIGQMLHSAGFAVTKVSGNHATPGAFFGGDSSKIIVLAERQR